MNKLNSLFKNHLTTNKIYNFPFFSSKFFCGRVFDENLKPIFDTSNNLEIARKQVYWRIRNIGQKELELLIGDWWDKNKENLSIKEINEFNDEVLRMDNSDMNNYFVKFIQPPENLIYTKRILETVDF